MLFYSAILHHDDKKKKGKGEQIALLHELSKEIGWSIFPPEKIPRKVSPLI